MPSRLHGRCSLKQPEIAQHCSTLRCNSAAAALVPVGCNALADRRQQHHRQPREHAPLAPSPQVAALPLLPRQAALAQARQLPLHAPWQQPSVQKAQARLWPTSANVCQRATIAHRTARKSSALPCKGSVHVARPANKPLLLLAEAHHHAVTAHARAGSQPVIPGAGPEQYAARAASSFPFLHPDRCCVSVPSIYCQSCRVHAAHTVAC